MIGCREGPGANAGVVYACFWDVDTSGQSGGAGGMGTNTAAMKILSTFTNANWMFPTIWRMDGIMNDGYPHLAWQDYWEVQVIPDNGPFAGGNRVIVTNGNFGAITNVTVGGVAASYIAQYDPSTGAWTNLGAGVNSGVMSLTHDGTNLYAGGGFSTAGGATVYRIAKRNTA